MSLDRRLELLEEQVTAIAAKLLFLEWHIRARLKEEAEAHAWRYESDPKD